MITILSVASACGLTLVMMAVDHMTASRGRPQLIAAIIVLGTIVFLFVVVPFIITYFSHIRSVRMYSDAEKEKQGPELSNVVTTGGQSTNDVDTKPGDMVSQSRALKPRRCVCAVACRRSFCIAVATPLIWISAVWLNRAASHRHIDDLHPLYACPLLDELMTQTLTYAWIIPFVKGMSIADDPEWCAHMKALERSGRVILGMHGVNHSDFFQSEYGAGEARAKLDDGIAEWQRCFNATPEHFAAPFASISLSNDALIRNEYGMHSRTNIDAFVFHRVYHCDDGFCSFGAFCKTSFLNVF